MRAVYSEDKKGCPYEWETFDEWYAEYKVWVKTSRGEAHKRAHSSCHGNSMGWYGPPDGFEGTLKAIDSGWPELRQQLFKLMEGVELDLPVYPSLTVNSTAQASVD